jgi:hypothetical protein
MTAYVESNFVLELALQQEECEACSAIVELASRGRLVLVVPAFSLAEPHVAIAGKEKARNQLRRTLDAQVRDLARSRPHHKVPSDFAAFAAVLADSAQFERDGLRKSVSAPQAPLNPRFAESTAPIALARTSHKPSIRSKDRERCKRIGA